jgi:zinc/manganese transport system permease protein
MLDILQFMAAPFVACLVLVGLHAYMGLHVLLRGVIFVDLALAQIAALGTITAIVAGHEPGTPAAYAFSLGATALGAAIFALTRMRRGTVPQEAIIGITCVVASAAAILLADRAPEGGEQIKELLAGAILWVSWKKVLTAALIYAGLGLFHLLFRRRFVLISENPDKAYAEGIRVRLWDFLFYLSFGLMITVSVDLAGVLMVFSYLVAPAIIALAYSARWFQRILFAWGVGILASALGLYSSYQWDLPSGPAIVCVLGFLLVIFAIYRGFRPAERQARGPSLIG